LAGEHGRFNRHRRRFGPSVNVHHVQSSRGVGHVLETGVAELLARHALIRLGAVVRAIIARHIVRSVAIVDGIVGL
jgi:hypothetical protein